MKRDELPTFFPQLKNDCFLTLFCSVSASFASVCFSFSGFLIVPMHFEALKQVKQYGIGVI